MCFILILLTSTYFISTGIPSGYTWVPRFNGSRILCSFPSISVTISEDFHSSSISWGVWVSFDSTDVLNVSDKRRNNIFNLVPFSNGFRVTVSRVFNSLCIYIYTERHLAHTLAYSLSLALTLGTIERRGEREGLWHIHRNGPLSISNLTERDERATQSVRT